MKKLAFCLFPMLLACSGPAPNGEQKEVNTSTSTATSVDRTAFFAEADRLSSAIPCGDEKVIDRESPPALWSCIGGPAETVKLFLNEGGQPAGFKNIKFMWNDWTQDRGYGVHADSDVAREWLGRVADIYAPSSRAELFVAFYENRNAEFRNDKYRIEYRYHSGPAIDERMIIIEPNQ